MRGVVPTELNRLTTRSRQRGFTLVEIAIAMVVIGLLLGATAITSRHLEEKRQLQREMQRLEIVRDAIVGYAIRNRTRERTLKVVPWDGPGEWEFRLPAGRPYLPCPDFDGDGYEDRMPFWAFSQGVEVKFNSAVTATIGELPEPWHGSLTWTHDAFVDPTTAPYGECRAQRGGVPWRTLGVAPSDGWGNRHTYFADPVFSNAMFGFDRQTVADIYDPNVPSAPGYAPAQRHFRSQYADFHALDPADRENADSHDDEHSSVRNCPAAICIGNSACEPFQDERIPEDISRCAWRLSADPENPTVFKGGLVALEAFNNGRKDYPAGSVIDGLPFVLLSHGPNGRFAVNHAASLQHRTRDQFGFFIPICNHPWENMGNSTDPSFVLPELDPPLRLLRFETLHGFRPQAVFNLSDTSCPEVVGNFLGERGAENQSSFIWLPPGRRDHGDFDDMLVWMTRGELTGAIRGRIPRIPPMIIAYFP